ncbi:MAG: LLM class flavin-dependent oxidoreductase [Chloroflexota bacterium]
MTNRAFRFGVVSTPQDDVDRWLNLARRVEALGYSSLLMPDGLHLLSPWASLAAAASATSALKVGTFVLASPLRHPRVAAWDAHSLAVMTRGRLELGIGTGRPEVARQAMELLGMPAASPAQRLAQVEQTIDHLRQLDGDQHTPIMIAAGGRQARALAAARADIVALAAAPLASRDEVALLHADLRQAAGSRFESLELSMNIFVVGDQVPPWMERFIGSDSATLAKHDSLTMLRGTPSEMADELKRRRDTFGVSYVTVNAAFLEQMASVVELLAGQ